jgi:cell division protein FtsI (penicillin-binding protein 3)
VAASALQRNTQKRLYSLGTLFLLWAGLVCGRLVQLQIFRYGDLQQHAIRQQQRTIEVAPKRGIIYDRQGHELAMSILVDSVFAVPSEIPDPATAAALLGRILKSDPAELRARFQASRTFTWVARKLDAEAAERIRSLNLRGIYFQKEPKRFYPKRELAAQILGYVGMDDEGLSGVERAYEERLQGRPGQMLISVDARKRWFGRVEREPEPGENVVLTLDESIQYIAEKELDAAMKQTHAAAGTVIVQNPHTGEVLALANRPTFNPNWSRGLKPEQLKNRAVSDVYEPGSTFKIVTLSAALDQKLTTPDDLVDCQMGSIVVGGMRIRDHRPFGVLKVSDVLARSSDVGAIKIGLRLGEERLDHYIRAYGFGAQTGIELPGETRGLAKPVSRWSKVSIGAISMGQEIGVSPLQLVSMVSTIANDGVWTAPRIVAATTEPRSTPQMVVFHPAQQRRVVSPLTAAEMRRMLEGVVENPHGTGKKAVLEGYTSAGKTGTAQKVDPATGTYSRTKYIASFAGFAPVNNPAITVVVILDSPAGLHQGGQVSAPVFQRVAQQVLAYLHAPHDLDLPKQRQLLLASREVNDDDLAESSPDRLGAPLEMQAEPKPFMPATGAAAQPSVAQLEPAAEIVRSLAPQPDALPSPPAVPDTPLPLPSRGTVVLDVEQGGIVVPSFLGKPLRSVVESAENSGLEVDAIGSGVATEQSPAAGSHVPAGAHVAVRFGR